MERCLRQQVRVNARRRETICKQTAGPRSAIFDAHVHVTSKFVG